MQEKPAGVDMIKLLHYLPSYCIASRIMPITVGSATVDTGRHLVKKENIKVFKVCSLKVQSEEN
jgi:hypothetical protein